MKNKLKTGFILGILLLAFFPLVESTYAFVGESASYKLTHSNINYGTGYSESPSYKLDFSLVEQPLGQSESANYQSSLGFYHGFASITAEDFGGKIIRENYPFLMLMMMIFIASDQKRKRENEEEE